MGDESVEHEDTLIGLQVEVRAAERELFKARLRRAMAMREANLAGVSKYRIAQVTGLSQTAVAKELARDDLPPTERRAVLAEMVDVALDSGLYEATSGDPTGIR